MLRNENNYIDQADGCVTDKTTVIEIELMAVLRTRPYIAVLSSFLSREGDRNGHL